jgi:hypothetical protein
MEEPLWSMRLRHPDKPVRLFPKNLASLDAQSKYVAQEKMDGFRLQIIRREGDDWTFLSRQLTNTIKLSMEMVENIKNLDIPEWSWLDAEWSTKRKAYRGPEMVTLFAANAWEGQLLNECGEDLRIKPILTLGLTDEWCHIPIRRARLIYDGFEDFFKETKEHWETEGIVLKHLEKPLILSRKKCVDNPAHIKIKWRDGNDGMTIVA